MKTQNCTNSLASGKFFLRVAAFFALAVLPFAAACSPQKPIEDAAQKISVKSSEADPEGARASRLRERCLKFAKLEPKEFAEKIKGDEARWLVSEAAALGEFPLLDALVAAGAPVGGRTDFPSVCAAADSGNSEILEWLLRKGADVNARTTKREVAPLFFALNKQNAEIVSLLLKNGADVNAPCAAAGAIVMRPLDVAVSEKNAELVSLLLANGADVNAENELSWTPLHEAVQDGEVELVRLLLDAGAKASLNRKAASAEVFRRVCSRISSAESDIPKCALRTPLALAVEGGNAEIVKMLVDAGADANGNGVVVLEEKSWSRTSNVYTEAPIAVLAARERKTELLKILIDAGANPRGEFELAELTKDGKVKKTKWTFPQVVVECGDAELLAKILPADADVNIPLADGTPMISRAAARGNAAVLNLLVEKGADIEKKDAQFLSPLAYAAAAGNAETAKLLLEKGAKPDSGLRGNKTPLWQAVISDKPETVALLLDAGADFRIANAEGKTMADFLAEKDFSRTLDVFLEKTKMSVPDKILFDCVRRGGAGALDVLLKRGGNVNARRATGHETVTLFSCALQVRAEKRAEFVSVLVKRGANVDALFRIDDFAVALSPLEFACASNSFAAAEALLAAGANPKLGAPLHLLCGAGFIGKNAEAEREALARKLIAAGADVNKRWNERTSWSFRDETYGYQRFSFTRGETPLMVAARLERLSIVRRLVESGADVNLLDENGKTALDKTRNKEIREILVNMGA